MTCHRLTVDDQRAIPCDDREDTFVQGANGFVIYSGNRLSVYVRMG